jgi:hypothetical protein
MLLIKKVIKAKNYLNVAKGKLIGSAVIVVEGGLIAAINSLELDANAAVTDLGQRHSRSICKI